VTGGERRIEVSGAPTLELYLARRFLAGVLGTFLFCFLIVFMIDIVEILRLSGKFGAVPAWKLFLITFLRAPAYTELLFSFAVYVGSKIVLLQLTRTGEFAVMRSGGMSVWQFLRPGIVVAFLFGLAAATVYNPLAASARGTADKLVTEAFGRETNKLWTRSGTWLRQNGVDGESVLNAASVSNGGTKLQRVTAFIFNGERQFSERLVAKEASLREGYWQLSDVMVTRIGSQPEHYEQYLIPTYLTPARAADAFGNVIALSLWELPTVIEIAEQANLSTSSLRVQFALLLSRPLLCVAMVLLAATVSLRSFRSGSTRTFIILGTAGGFLFYVLAELSRQLGVAGLTPAWAAVWIPVMLAIVMASTALLIQEDG
jgi:lipopolysaccharide export system permease protein